MAFNKKDLPELSLAAIRCKLLYSEINILFLRMYNFSSLCIEQKLRESESFFMDLAHVLAVLNVSKG